jgi:hypothetical protein
VRALFETEVGRRVLLDLKDLTLADRDAVRFLKRTGYAVSRLLITRTDAGGRTFNFSEIVGNGVGAGISDAYYPPRERTWTKTYQKWTTQTALDGVFNIVKEFWPNINHSIFHGKY